MSLNEYSSNRLYHNREIQFTRELEFRRIAMERMAPEVPVVRQVTLFKSLARRLQGVRHYAVAHTGHLRLRFFR